jgi:hypothetical protein
MRRSVCVALLLVFSLLGAQTARAADTPSIAALLAKIESARGADPPSYREVRTSSDGTRSTIVRIGKDFRTFETSGPIEWQYGTYRGEDWHQNPNGVTVVEEPDPSDTSENTDSRSVTDGQITSNPDTLAVTADGYVLSELDRNGFGTRTTVDPQTLHLKRYERLRRNRTTTITIVDYAAFGMQMLPAHWTIADADGNVATVTRVSRGEGATPANVKEPGIRRLLVDIPGTEPVKIPARFDGASIYVPVTINGHKLNFELDSGSSDIAIDADVAKSIGLTLMNQRMTTNARTSATSDAIVSSIGIGPVSMSDIVVSTVKLTPDIAMNAKDYDHIDGLLGFDFFATTGVSVDYSNKTVTVTPATTYVPPADKSTMPLDIRLGRQVPQISVALDGVVADRFIVDTGNGLSSYVVFDYFMDKHPHVGERSSQAVAAIGVGGMFAARLFFVHTFKIGTWAFQDFSGVLAGAGSYEQPEDGLIGPGFLVLFRTDFDYAHGRIYLTPTTNTKQMLHIR